MLYVKYQSIWTASSWEKDFLKFHFFLPLFYPYGAPIGASPLIFANLNPHSPKDASYQIWLKSVQWFWRSHLNEKFTPDDRRRTDGDHYSSFEPSAHELKKTLSAKESQKRLKCKVLALTSKYETKTYIYITTKHYHNDFNHPIQRIWKPYKEIPHVILIILFW